MDSQTNNCHSDQANDFDTDNCFTEKCVSCSKHFNEGDSGVSLESFSNMQPHQNDDNDLIELVKKSKHLYKVKKVVIF